MNNLHIESDRQTPFVLFNADTGILEISGKAGNGFIEEYEIDLSYWDKILNWVNTYIETPCLKTTFICKLYAFDTTAPKQLLKIFKALENLKDPLSAEISWHVEKNDEDILDVIDDFNCILKNIKIQVVLMG